MWTQPLGPILLFFQATTSVKGGIALKKETIQQCFSFVWLSFEEFYSYEAFLRLSAMFAFKG